MNQETIVENYLKDIKNVSHKIEFLKSYPNSTVNIES